MNAFAFVLASPWRPLALRGVVSVLVGGFLLCAPGPSRAALITICGICLVGDGVLTLAAAGWQPSSLVGFTLLVEGLVAFALGFGTLLSIDMSMTDLGNVLALWALLTGGLEMLCAARLRGKLEVPLALAIAGVVSLAFGLRLVLQDRTRAPHLTTVLGAFAVAFGLSMMLVTAQLRTATRGASGEARG